MPGARFASGAQVTLHTVEEDDLDAVARARNDPALRVPRGLDDPQGDADVEQFHEETVSEGEGYWFVVAVDGETVGGVAFPAVDQAARAAELSAWILPEFQRSGYGSDAVETLLSYGFEELRLNRVRADCPASAEAARALLASLGFTEEGRFREAAFHGGEHRDVLRYGLLAEEWEVA